MKVCGLYNAPLPVFTVSLAVGLRNAPLSRADIAVKIMTANLGSGFFSYLEAGLETLENTGDGHVVDGNLVGGMDRKRLTIR